ncbi:MAG: glutathione S-transferase N-terminal domain-containing protein [Pseudomonas aeruginosa]|nr:glutathione S-transferase N-terminal domain-containing protein [Pseudomonas aeruginosa]
MYKVYGDYRSGNCYKIKLAMSLLGIDYQWVPVDILKGETQTPEFLAKNPNGYCGLGGTGVCLPA